MKTTTNTRHHATATLLSLLCVGLFALSLGGCAEAYYTGAYYTPDDGYRTYYGPDYYPYIRITVIMAERITMAIEATDYLSFPQVTLPTDLSIRPRSCDCHALVFCRSMGLPRHGPWERV